MGAEAGKQTCILKHPTSCFQNTRLNLETDAGSEFIWTSSLGKAVVSYSYCISKAWHSRKHTICVCFGAFRRRARFLLQVLKQQRRRVQKNKKTQGIIHAQWIPPRSDFLLQKKQKQTKQLKTPKMVLLQSGRPSVFALYLYLSEHLHFLIKRCCWKPQLLFLPSWVQDETRQRALFEGALAAACEGTPWIDGDLAFWDRRGFWKITSRSMRSPYGAQLGHNIV